MSTKNINQITHHPTSAGTHRPKANRRPQSLMAVQEKLGLFRPPCPQAGAENQKNCHDFLKRKPLGFM